MRIPEIYVFPVQSLGHNDLCGYFKINWFNCGSFIYLLLYLLFKEIFKDPKPCLYLLFTGFSFSFNEAKTS